MTTDEICERFLPWQAKTLGQSMSVVVSLIVMVAECSKEDAIRYAGVLLDDMRKQLERDKRP